MTDEEDLKQRYFDWLCTLARPDWGGSEYTGLFRFAILHETEFYELVANDENRAKDGKALREEFANEIGDGSVLYILQGPCSMLEMLIGLAKRMSYMTEGWVQESSVGRWFDEMLDNVMRYSRADFQRSIRNVVERRYDSFGRGSLFPMIMPKRDMRNIEIWLQMNQYLMEKYPDEFE